MQKAIEFNNDNIKFCILHDYNFYKNEIIEKKLKISPEILQELGRILKESYMNLGEEKDLIEANPNNIIMIACSSFLSKLIGIVSYPILLFWGWIF